MIETAVKSHFSTEQSEKREQFIKDGKTELHKLINEYFGEMDADSNGS
jgi:hypothetical protein